MATPFRPLCSSSDGEPYPQGSFALPAVQINAGARSILTAAVPAARVGDKLVLGLTTQLDLGLLLSDWGCYVDGTVSLTVYNPTAGNITPAVARSIGFTLVPTAGG